MKKLNKIIAGICAFAVVFGNIAAPAAGIAGVSVNTEASDVVINADNFPDENFRAYISENIDKNGGGILSAAVISETTEINAAGIRDISVEIIGDSKIPR